MANDLKQRIDKLVRRARSELENGNRNEALGILKKALALDPGSNAITEVMLEIENEMSSSKASDKPEASPEYTAPAAQKTAAAPNPKTDSDKQKRPARKTGRSSSGLKSVPDARPVRKKAAPQTPKPSSDKEGSDDSGLQALLQQLDNALDEGEEARAKSLMGKVKKLSPDTESLRQRMARLKNLLKAKKAIAKGQSELKSGEPAKAVRYARMAFDHNPRVEGLDSLLRRLESLEEIDRSPTEGQEWAKEKEPQPGADPKAESFVQKIREKVQISSFPEAAQLAKEALELYPDHELIATFAEKFKKMGLLEVED
ncbi:hypothetical protein GF402_08610 [Candidatus Fermentibacteria bacterium]|nr:hypothetical protein [Candidatus Fermentibacteria bacterium]